MYLSKQLYHASRSWWLEDISNALRIAIGVTIFVRLAIFFGSMAWPIPNENQTLVSPLHEQGYFDFTFYVQALIEYRSSSLADLLDKFIAFYQRPFQEQFGHVIAGPVFPLFIGISGYAEGNTFPLALAFLILNCVWSVMWLNFMSKHGLGITWLILFALAPNPIWFTLVVSPDLLFAAFVGFFYFAYFRESQNIKTTLIWVVFLILILLTRPNGYSMLIFVIADFTWSHLCHGKKKGLAIIALILLGCLFALYLYPYFITELRRLGNNHVFFGSLTTDYAKGLFAFLPHWLDVFISSCSLLGAKILYFVGLRPAYGAAPDLLVILRGLPGLILLPGLLWGLSMAGRRHAVFLFLFCLPILGGPSQDRYNLPIYPLLFMFGAVAYKRLWRACKTEKFDST